jgi:hypothetical protein
MTNPSTHFNQTSNELPLSNLRRSQTINSNNYINNLPNNAQVNFGHNYQPLFPNNPYPQGPNSGGGNFRPGGFRAQ